jgi:hypothetical protein
MSDDSTYEAPSVEEVNSDGDLISTAPGGSIVVP